MAAKQVLVLVNPDIILEKLSKLNVEIDPTNESALDLVQQLHTRSLEVLDDITKYLILQLQENKK